MPNVQSGEDADRTRRRCAAENLSADSVHGAQHDSPQRFFQQRAKNSLRRRKLRASLNDDHHN